MRKALRFVEKQNAKRNGFFEVSKFRIHLGTYFRSVNGQIQAPQLQSRIIYFPKNQVTPNMKETVFMPEFGLCIPAQE
jgi:hypothetical protein